jgi:hypothetical protein
VPVSFFGQVSHLAKTSQRVVFAQERDHRPALAGLAHHRGGDAGDIASHPEALVRELLGMNGDRFMLAIAGLGNGPYCVGQGVEARLRGFDMGPDRVFVHGRLLRAGIVSGQA